MASLKEVKTRINSVKSTRKITSAMKMVASAKLHKAQGAIENMLPYQKKLNKILTNFLSADLPIESPYVQEREVKRVAIVVFSSNTSLCGAFNANVIKMMMQTIGEFRTLGQDNILIFPIGKKVDEAKETIAELLLVDDDTILVNDELLKGLDKELDEFLKELLEK